MPIGVFVTMTAKSGTGDELLRRVCDIMADVRTEQGNLMTTVLRDPAEPDKVFAFEVYRDQAAIDEHRQAHHTLTKSDSVRELYGAPLQARFLETVDWDLAKAAI